MNRSQLPIHWEFTQTKARNIFGYTITRSRYYGLTRQQFRKLGVFFRELRFKLLTLSQRLRRNRRGLGQQHRIKIQSIGRLVCFAVRSHQPEANMKQLPYCVQIGFS